MMLYPFYTALSSCEGDERVGAWKDGPCKAVEAAARFTVFVVTRPTVICHSIGASATVRLTAQPALSFIKQRADERLLTQIGRTE